MAQLIKSFDTEPHSLQHLLIVMFFSDLLEHFTHSEILEKSFIVLYDCFLLRFLCYPCSGRLVLSLRGFVSRFFICVTRT